MRQTKAAALRLRTSEMAAMILVRITSGRSLTVVWQVAMEKGNETLRWIEKLKEEEDKEEEEDVSNGLVAG